MKTENPYLTVARETLACLSKEEEGLIGLLVAPENKPSEGKFVVPDSAVQLLENDPKILSVARAIRVNYLLAHPDETTGGPDTANVIRGIVQARLKVGAPRSGKK